MAVAPCGVPYVGAAEKWTALQDMHEQYGVPLEVLKPLGGCSSEYFDKKVASGNWQFGSSSQTMLARMSAAAERQLTRIQTHADELCDEKQARALSMMAKTLETITGIERQLEKDRINNHGAVESDGDPERDSKRASAAALEAELSELVEAMS